MTTPMKDLGRRHFLVAALFGGAAGAAPARGAPEAGAVGSDPRYPFGRLQAPDANGVQLPRGFTSRVIARTGQRVSGTSYVWHAAPDGAAILAGWGGYSYVSNSEVGSRGGGVSVIQMDGSGRVLGARRLLSGTSWNCSGGPTPWNTYLSCEEHSRGRVYEVAPFSQFHGAKVHDAMGWFTHEAAACDADRRVVYMTEDRSDGCLYRYVPHSWPDLRWGRLQVLAGRSGSYRWADVRNPTPSSGSTSTRHQVSDAVRFRGGEGCWYHRHRLYFTTKGDDRVWILEPGTMRLRILYDVATAPDKTLRGVDQCVIAPTGDLAVAEDGDNYEVIILGPDGRPGVACRLTGVRGSEITGLAFNPWGSRCYFASQRNPGAIYEVAGNFTYYR